jgi:hypothetical protein
MCLLINSPTHFLNPAPHHPFNHRPGPHTTPILSVLPLCIGLPSSVYSSGTTGTPSFLLLLLSVCLVSLCFLDFLCPTSLYLRDGRDNLSLGRRWIQMECHVAASLPYRIQRRIHALCMAGRAAPDVGQIGRTSATHTEQGSNSSAGCGQMLQYPSRHAVG